MDRGKRYKHVRRKKRKPGRQNGLLFLLLLVVAGAIIFQGYRRVTGGLKAQAHEFMAMVEAGDQTGAGAILADRDRDLDELIDLFHEPEIEYAGIGKVRLSGLVGGWAEIKLKSDGIILSAPLLLVRKGWEWRILDIPEVSTVTGAFVLEERDKILKLFWNGLEKEIRLPWAIGLELGAVVRIRLVEGTAVFVEQLEELKLSRLIRRSASEVEGEIEGSFPLGEDLPIYIVEQNKVSAGKMGDLLIGRKNLHFYTYAGSIVAARVEGRHDPQTIRVVLRQDLGNLDADNLLHRQIRLSGETAVYLEDRIGGQRYEFPAGEVLLVEPMERGIRVTAAGGPAKIFKNRIWFTPEAGRITIISLQRSGLEGPPAYRGSIDIGEQGGYLVVVNEPLLEQYLYAVLPSEMPPAFGLEALKAQAVAARTYAYNNIFCGRFSEYGAHVDDSVLSQVYNNKPEQPRTNEAVDATAGMVLFFGGAAADTRFFSTSSGYTASFHEVWHDPATGSFPGQPIPYLMSASQVPGKETRFQTEAEIQAFLRRGDWPAYDAGAPFFRWQVEMSAEELAASINQNLSPRYQHQPDFILTRDGDQFRSMEIPENPLGELLDLRVIQRGAGGNLMILEVEGTNGTYRINKEFNIRFTIRPVQYLEGAPAVLLTRADGSILANYSILPSAFVFFELLRHEDGRLARVIINGGGNGHGVGMSQHGARGMALQGHDFYSILDHYYPGTEVRTIYGGRN